MRPIDQSHQVITLRRHVAVSTLFTCKPLGTMESKRNEIKLNNFCGRRRRGGGLEIGGNSLRGTPPRQRWPQKLKSREGGRLDGTDVGLSKTF